MKKVISLITLLLVMITGTVHAASYTLPEKMYNQLAIGSGLKGSFTISSEGELFSNSFLNAVTDAEFSVRGILSGTDYHYYVFQTNEQEQQSALSELYRKDGVLYFRSDMVPGTILTFPDLGQFIAKLFPRKGENPEASSFISNIIQLPEADRREKWEPVLLRYQNELELWLADFTVNADTVKLESGFSALDFTYEIPVKQIYDKIVSLYAEFASDEEVSSLLESVMTLQEKQVYVNGQLLYFYQEALKSLNLDRPVIMNKRVSAMGDLLRFKLQLPLDERTTGFTSVEIETIDSLTVYTLRKSGQVYVLGIPSADVFAKTAYEQSIWYANVKTNPGENDRQQNKSVRIDIKKTNEVHEEDEKTHETDHYTVTVTQDTDYLPKDIDPQLLQDSETMHMEIDFHYSSKYAQNSATTLDMEVDVHEGNSALQIHGKLKTAAPWLFMPFEVLDPIQTGTDPDTILNPYLTDWISNAASMIHHNANETNQDNTGDSAATTEDSSAVLKEEEEKQEETSDEAEAIPLDETNSGL